MIYKGHEIEDNKKVLVEEKPYKTYGYNWVEFTLEDLENFRKQHHTFISEYRRKYVDSVTADDVKLIKTNVDNIIDQMKKIISEVIGYGRAT